MGGLGVMFTEGLTGGTRKLVGKVFVALARGQGLALQSLVEAAQEVIALEGHSAGRC